MKRVLQRSAVVLVTTCLVGVLFFAQAGAQGDDDALPAGDVGQGEDLFRGVDRFDNGGPPCMACHSVGGLDGFGGGALGPDLSTSSMDWDGGVLATLPFPTMAPVFGDRPLTEAEQADLAAFLNQAGVAGRSSSAVLTLFGFAALGAIILLALMGVIWRGRSKGVREPMVSGAGATP